MVGIGKKSNCLYLWRPPYERVLAEVVIFVLGLDEELVRRHQKDRSEHDRDPLKPFHRGHAEGYHDACGAGGPNRSSIRRRFLQTRAWYWKLGTKTATAVALANDETVATSQQRHPTSATGGQARV